MERFSDKVLIWKYKEKGTKNQIKGGKLLLLKSEKKVKESLYKKRKQTRKMGVCVGIIKVLIVLLNTLFLVSLIDTIFDFLELL